MAKAAVYHYREVPPPRVGDELNALFASLQSEDQQFGRSANANFLMLIEDAGRLTGLDQMIDDLALVHPARFFVVLLDEAPGEVKTEISARCHGLSKTEHACSEVVRIRAPRRLLKGAASVVRGNLLTGVGTELLLESPSSADTALEVFESLVDLVYFDSGELEQPRRTLAKLESMRVALVDLQWIALGPWRDEIKRVFDLRPIRAALPRAESVGVTGGNGKGRKFPVAPYLFAGWLVDRLALRAIEERDGGVRCHGDGRHGVREVLVSPQPAGVPHLTGACMRFTDGGRGELRSLELRRLGGDGAELLETTLDVGEQLRSIRPCDTGTDLISRLRRYFIIGESTLNYRGSLVQALELARWSGAE